MSSKHSRSPSPTHEPRKRGRIACVACRQAKVRCDLVVAPCSRCTKMQLDCSVDPGFKRTNKRDKFNELEDNVQRLQSIVEKHQAGGQNGATVIANNHGETVASSGSPPHNGQSSRSVSQPIQENTNSKQNHAVVFTSSSDSRSLGDICQSKW